MLLWEEIAVVIVGMFKCITSKSKKLQVNQTFYIYDYFIVFFNYQYTIKLINLLFIN